MNETQVISIFDGKETFHIDIFNKKQMQELEKEDKPLYDFIQSVLERKSKKDE